jgi:hypothetical protein
MLDSQSFGPGNAGDDTSAYLVEVLLFFSVSVSRCSLKEEPLENMNEMNDRDLK